MSSFEIGAARPVGAVQPKLVTGKAACSEGGVPCAETSSNAAPAAMAAPQVEAGAALKAGAAPVDQDRVATIRKAIEEGRYPVIPTRVADAMIAAGMLWRTPQ